MIRLGRSAGFICVNPVLALDYNILHKGKTEVHPIYLYLQPTHVTMVTDSITKVTNGGMAANTVVNVLMGNLDSTDVIICKYILCN